MLRVVESASFLCLPSPPPTRIDIHDGRANLDVDNCDTDIHLPGGLQRLS
jgi:hypothetical protein